MKLNKVLTVAVVTLGLCVASALAQDNGAGGGGGGRRGNRGGGGGGGNFDPAQFQQRMMDRVKETLEVTDDNEWKAIQPLVQKVMDARMAAGGGMRGGMFGRGMRGGPGGGGDQGGAARPTFGPQPLPEAEALQKAIESKASNSELKAAMAKFVEARKAKQAELEKAQAELRKVLSVRQEAIATANSYL
jgi:hypothetical protein